MRVPFEVREILARVLDGSRFEEFKPLYGDKLVCGWGSICGFPVGVLGNNGILFSEEAEKGSAVHPAVQPHRHAARVLPEHHRVHGRVEGRAAAASSSNGAKLINAVSNSTVPHFVLMVGASYGAGNYGMSGKAYDPRFIFTWPNHRIAVMGPRQLAGVMDIVARNAAAGRGIEVDEEQLAAADGGARGSRSKASRRRCSRRDGCGTTGSSTPTTPGTVLGMAISAAHSNEVRGATEYGVWRH